MITGREKGDKETCDKCCGASTKMSHTPIERWNEKNIECPKIQDLDVRSVISWICVVPVLHRMI